MSGGLLIVVYSIYILYKINSQYHKIDTYNNEILQQKEAINKISLICENLKFEEEPNYRYCVGLF